MTASVDIKGVTRAFGEAEALRGVDLAVRSGELFVILGPSGCGKTTLLRAVAGLERVDGGEISIDGRVVTSPSSRTAPAERGLGYVHQDLALWPHMTVLEHLTFALGARDKTARDRALALLTELRLDGLSRRRPAELSGGEGQRLALARALVADPGLLLLDEPLSSLDPAIARDVRTSLAALNRERGVTMLHVTHLQDEAFELADRIAVMRAGRIEQVGTPEEIYARPASAFVADFVGSCSLVPGDVDRAAGRFRCVLGELPFAQEGLDGAASVRLALRETDVHLREGDDGEVVEAVYRGGAFTHRVRMDGCEILTRDVARWNPGRRVALETTAEPWYVEELE